LAVAGLGFYTFLGNLQFEAWGGRQIATAVFIGSFTHAHIFLVFARSHINRAIFKRHWIRFTVIPISLLVAMLCSDWVLVSFAVLGTFWDIYHSSLQTFGLGRMYDRKTGNDPNKGRALDIWLSLFLYIGPLVASANLLPTLSTFDRFQAVGSAFFTSIPAAVMAHHRTLVPGLTAAALVFLAFYLFAQARLEKEGYRASAAKIVLFLTTGVVSFYSWLFLPFVVAMFVVNFFHAWQYFAVVYWSEKKNLNDRFGPRAFLVVVLTTAVYGLLVTVTPPAYQMRWAFCFITLMSTLHYWYDGFIWSVRKGEL
jgi:hypothetical protein